MSALTADDVYADAAATATATAVAVAYPLLGLGVVAKELIDTAATAVLAASLTMSQTRLQLGPVATAGCEGARDGAPPLQLRDSTELGAAPANLWCDPIDGTLNAARGGPRSASVVTFSSAAATANYLDDSQSIFAIGSNSTDVFTIFDDDGSWHQVVGDHLQTATALTATLNREDNRALLFELAGHTGTPIRVGSRSGYRPSIAGQGWVAVGDATITLPMECDLEFGRIGLVEAQIQSGLYRSWAGLVVSRDTIARYPGGQLGYITSYLRALAHGDTAGLRSLFTEAELGRFDAGHVPIEQVCAPLHPDRFGIGRAAVTAISTLTSPFDPGLGTASGAFNDPVWDSDRGCLTVDTVIRSGASVRRQSTPVIIESAAAFPPEIAAWYRTLHWADQPGLADIPGWAQGQSSSRAPGLGARR